MSKILDWIKKHVWQTVIIILGILLLPLILVHVAYRITAISPWFASTWSSGELIMYIAGFEAFLGAVFLGIIAATQNERNVDINDRLLKIEETSSSFQRYPNVKVDSLEALHTTYNELPRNDCIMFMKKDVVEDFNTRDNILNEPLVLFSFNIRNLSKFNVTINVENLSIHSWVKKINPIPFETTNIGLRSKYNVIAPEESVRLSFFVFEFDLEGFVICDARMSVAIQNNVNENFRCSVLFNILANQTTNHFLVHSENTVRIL